MMKPGFLRSDRAAAGGTIRPHRLGGRTRTIVLVAAAALSAVLAAGVVADRETRPALICGPLIQIPAADRLVVVWKMDAFFTHGSVVVSSAGRRLEVDATQRDGQRYEAVLTGLPPGAAFEYTIVNYGFLHRPKVVAGPFRAAMPALRGQSFRFVAFGDSGNGSHTQAALATLMAVDEPDVVIHTGDLIYPAGAAANYLSNFYEPNAALIRSAPFMPCLGNHDCQTDHGSPLLDEFVLPTNGPAGVEPGRYYWFDFGDVRFVAMDTNSADDSSGGVLTPQRMKDVVAPWLAEVLTDCDARWRIVYHHQPIYTGSIHSLDEHAYVKEIFQPVFDACHVDLVFAGHNHLFERSAPMRDNRVVADGAGVVYVTTGAGGTTRYMEGKPTPTFIRAFNDKVFSFTRVDVSADRLELRQIDPQGRVIDEYTLNKRAGPPPA